MATVTTEQWERVLARLQKIETTINDLVEAQNHFITLLQLQQLSVVYTADITDVRERVEALETRVETIENEPLS